MDKQQIQIYSILGAVACCLVCIFLIEYRLKKQQQQINALFAYADMHAAAMPAPAPRKRKKKQPKPQTENEN